MSTHPPSPDLPPTRTVEPLDPPPESGRPTTAMLKGDIDSGRTGDKNPVFDPGLSPLGTDDEAAGRPPSAFRVALARRLESAERWLKDSRRAGAAHHKADGFPVGFAGAIAAIAAAILVGIWIFASGPTPNGS
jgi:hypothetical protein